VRLTWRGACWRTGGANPTPARENDPWHSANAPLHWDLKGDGSNGVLSRFELSSVLALDVEEGNGVEGVGDGVLLLHTQEGDVRKRHGHWVSDAQHGGKVITICGG
jgi:hypothetical protein